jgi:ArsR family transcriptional regulator
VLQAGTPGEVFAAPADQRVAELLAAAFEVIAYPARLRLLSPIASKPDGEACVCDVVEPPGLTQPTVGHRLRVLHEAGLVSRAKRGVWVYYRLVPERLRSCETRSARRRSGNPPADVSPRLAPPRTPCGDGGGSGAPCQRR